MALLTADDLSQFLVRAEYAVRGPIPALATKIEAEIKADKAAGRKSKYPFEKMIFCNIGNPQSIGQQYLTYPRLVSSLVTAPHLLDFAARDPSGAFPPDVVARAKYMVAQMGDTGGYSPSNGIAFVQRDIAAFIDQRDNVAVKADPQMIYLTNGASQAVTFALQMVIGKPTDGVMIPTPQYPLYSALLALLNGTRVDYLLDESKNWAVTAAELESSFRRAKAAGISPRAIVIINPGNPTGQVLDAEHMREIVTWAHSRRVLILADEVYQANVYAENKRFHSFREIVLTHVDPRVRAEVQLVSCHSASKGIHGECGRRGGYIELINLPPAVVEVFNKLPSINVCPTIMGQVMMSLVVKGPNPGEASYAKHAQECDDIYQSLRRRAKALPVQLRKVPGITCNDIEGAMYAFPSLRLPLKFIELAAAKKIAADALWCRGLVEEEGVVTVPGSGFGQAVGTYHFRTTILPPENEMQDVARRIDAYQRRIISKYGPISGAGKL